MKIVVDYLIQHRTKSEIDLADSRRVNELENEYLLFKKGFDSQIEFRMNIHITTIGCIWDSFYDHQSRKE